MKQKAELSCVLLTVWVFLVFISCASNPAAYVGIDATVLDGSFETALVKLDEEKNNPGGNRASVYKNPKNEILYYIDKGVIAHYAGLYQESFENLQMAEQLIEEAYTKSITQEIGSYIVNDNTRDYAGEDYEDLYINIFNALNFYHTGNLEGAMVEIRRLNEKANNLADKYERATKKVQESNQQMRGQPATEASRFSNSALARYMGILFYRTMRNPDSMRIEYEELQRAYRLAPAVYANPIPSSVREDLLAPVGAARLNVIAFTGLSPVKEEESIMIPLPLPAPNNVAKVALPKMVSRPQLVNRVEVVLDSGEKFNLELLEDMGAVARETFKSRYALTVAKSTARAIIKATAGAAAAQATRKANAMAGLAVGIAGRVAAQASERADTRISRYFPNNALVGGINLEPGTYTITVNFYGDGGLVNSQRREVTVQRNSLNLEQLVYLGDTSAPEPFTAPRPDVAATHIVANAPPAPRPVASGGPVQIPANLNISGYFVDVNRQPTGPLSDTELRQLMSQGLLTKDTLVWKEGMPSWSPAWMVPELAPLFAPAAPPPLPPPPLPPLEEPHAILSDGFAPATTELPSILQRPVPDGFVGINGGTFTMGSPENEVGRSRDEGPQRRITISPFYMGKYEVTQKEYLEIMGKNPSNVKGSNLPVEEVSWFDAIEYCNKQSQKEGLIPAYTINDNEGGKNVIWNRNANGYRLPTEAEWEYACRAGTRTPFSAGNNIVTSQANYNGNFPYNNNAKGEYRNRTTSVDSFAANQWGLFDMHGNVWEWCWDWYGNYTDGAQTDPIGVSSGSRRVSRGGSWENEAVRLRSAHRNRDSPSRRDNAIGFRVARNME